MVSSADPLPSWRDTAPKKSILDFVAAVTDSSSADFVPEAERIAVFDNDGTLWAEKPVPFQAIFAAHRLDGSLASREEPGRRVVAIIDIGDA